MNRLLPFLLLLSGCGAASVYQQCDYLSPEDQADYLLLIEADRDIGWSKAEELSVLGEGCQGDLDCLSCGTALINAVYGG